MGVEYIIYTAWHFAVQPLFPSKVPEKWRPGNCPKRGLCTIDQNSDIRQAHVLSYRNEGLFPCQHILQLYTKDDRMFTVDTIIRFHSESHTTSHPLQGQVPDPFEIRIQA